MAYDAGEVVELSGSMSIGGLASGLKTDEIIAKIMEYARQPQNNLISKQAEAQNRLTAWQSINTRILALKMKADGIADNADFQAMQVTSSNQSIVTATADTSAVPGTYYIKVTSKAQAHQIGSQTGAYATVNDMVGTGTVAIGLANGTSFEVELDENNNTLSGLRDAINRANKGVKATIVNAGTSQSPDYRLVLTSSATGLQNQITSVDTSDLAGGTAPTFNLAEPIQPASSATVVLGEGAGYITVSRDTNVITELIPGVTLNINGAGADEVVRIDVARDRSAIKSSIRSFVEQYNGLMDAIDEQFEYDADAGSSGVLMGDYLLQSVQMEIESTVTGIVSGLTSQYSALSQIGITLDTGGHLSIDDAQLSVAIDENPEAVAKLFGTNLDTDSSYISLVASNWQTKPSGPLGWNIEVTQTATRAQATAGTALAGDLDADECLTINSTRIELTAGMDLDAVIAAINEQTSKTGATAVRTGADGTGTGDYLTIRRVQYGSSYTLSVLSSRSRTAGDTSGFGNVLVAQDDWTGQDGLGCGALGVDVAGRINGEVATGKGQILSLKSDSTNDAKGVSLLIRAGAPLGTVNVKLTKGTGRAIQDLLYGMTSSKGVLATAQAGVNTEITSLQDSIIEMETRLSTQEAALWSKFNAMESQLAKLQQQGNFISAQLSSLNNSK